MTEEKRVLMEKAVNQIVGKDINTNHDNWCRGWNIFDLGREYEKLDNKDTARSLEHERG